MCLMNCDGGAARAVSFPCLMYGTRSDAVYYVQYTLYLKGFYKGMIDGVYGLETEKAVLSFQRQNNMPMTGIIDLTTWSRMFYYMP